MSTVIYIARALRINDAKMATFSRHFGIRGIMLLCIEQQRTNCGYIMGTVLQYRTGQ